jgi:hypothetical protein
MATRAVTVEDISGDGSVKKFTWTGLANGDDGVPIDWAQWADRSIQVLGTFGAAGNLRWLGSNDDGTTYATLTDPQGNALDITSAKIESITEISQKAKPSVTAGDGTTSLTVVVIARRQNSMRT